MKIAILSLRSRFGDVTGDCVQAEKTAKALRLLGEEADRYYIEPSDGTIYDSNNEKIGVWQYVFPGHDIVHAIPPIPSKFLVRLPKIKAKLVCSTVFWRSLTYTRVVHKNIGRLSFAIIKEYVRDLLAMVGIKQLRVYKCYDLLLPNSEDEIKVLHKYAQLGKGVKIVAIPNAIDEIPNHADKLERSSLVPADDYVLVPGCFAARKNQITLIKALTNFSNPVVFMGKGPLLEKCKNVASRNMHFIGHVEHGTDEFYAIIRHARVVCLPSNCETPGIAGLEATAFGARPVVPYEGGTCQYYGWDAEYHNPIDEESLLNAVVNAWRRGRLEPNEYIRYRKTTWNECAKQTLNAYNQMVRQLSR